MLSPGDGLQHEPGPRWPLAEDENTSALASVAALECPRWAPPLAFEAFTSSLLASKASVLPRYSCTGRLDRLRLEVGLFLGAATGVLNAQRSCVPKAR